LDGKRKQEILPFPANLNREFNIPVLYVTHAQQEVAQLAAHVVIMADAQLLIQARDVSVALQMPVATSILDVLPAIISGIIDLQAGHTILRLTVGDQSLLAHVIRKSAVLLALGIGKGVCANQGGFYRQLSLSGMRIVSAMCRQRGCLELAASGCR